MGIQVAARTELCRSIATRCYMVVSVHHTYEHHMFNIHKQQFPHDCFKVMLLTHIVCILWNDAIVLHSGGITEARRIVALASAYDVPIIPHGSSIYSYHLQYAFPNLPMSEFLVLAPNGDEVSPY